MTKILVLGIDAANIDLLDRWRSDLPAIAGLRARGTLHATIGLEDFFVGSTWPSLYTGLHPGNHGHHALVQLIPGTYTYRRMTDGPLLQGRPFWDHLSAAGRSVAVLDVPLTQLSADLNGIQTVEWGSHDALYGFRAYPPALEDSIEERFGRHPLGGSCDGLRSSSADYASFLAALARGIETKTRITRELLSQHPWDFAMQVFTEAHCAGHQSWHLHDPSHPAHDAAVVTQLGDPLQAVYRLIDTAIAEVLKITSRDTTIVLLSAHGMSYWYGMQFLLRDVLCALGVTRAATATPSETRRRKIGTFLDTTWRTLPMTVRDTLRPFVRAALTSPQKPAETPSLNIEPSSSRCFPVINGQPVGGVRLNISGREPNGILAAGDVDRFCTELIRDLLEIKDERTGEPAITRVVRSAERYPGRAQKALPDLLIHWNDKIPTGCVGMGAEGAGQVSLTSPKIGRLEGANRYARTGEHRPPGFCLVVKPHTQQAEVGPPIRLIDIAPSIAAAYGVQLPEADGRAIPGLLD